jgi:Ca-activated chloride channel homolog
MKIQILLGLGLLWAASASAQLANDERSIIKEGNTYYLSQDYAKASEWYKRYLDKNNNISPTANYNFGNTAYRQNDFDKAIEAFTRSTEQASDADTKAKAFHNLGNTYLKKNDYEKAAEAYKNALRQTPNDLDTKNNLAYAMRQVQQQKQQQQKQQQEKEQKDEKQDDQNKDNPEKDKTPPKEEPKDDKKKDDGEPNEPKDNSDKLMDIIEQEDKNTQKKLQERQAKGKKKDIEKDW